MPPPTPPLPDRALLRRGIYRLLFSGRTPGRRAQSRAFDALAELAWTRATGRRDELGLVEDRRSETVALLERAWDEGLSDLAAHGLPLTPRMVGTGFSTHARHTAASFATPHSKATLTEARRSSLGETEATHNGTVRLRPPAGLKAWARHCDIDLTAVARVLGEVAIPERAFMDGLQLEGERFALVHSTVLGALRRQPRLTGTVAV